MANAKAYRVLQDTSLPFPLRTSVTTDGVEIQETRGQAYAAGDYVLHDELTQRDQDRVESGDLDGFLEEVDLQEALDGRQASDRGLFIPEHEVERYALLDVGHRIVERDQVIDLRSAGADAAREALEGSRKGPNDANPEITEQDSFVQTPNLADVSRGEEENVPVEHDRQIAPVEVETQQSSSDAGVEMPPGLPVGPTLAKAEGADPEKVDKEAEKIPAKRAARKKPGGSSSSSSSGSGGNS
jgi:hypothetical protein